MPKRVPIPANRRPFPDRRRPGCYRVPLGPRRNKTALIDAASLHLVDNRRWHWMPGPRGTAGYACRWSKRTGSIKLARVIAGVKSSNKLVGHANDDTLDCRRSNLLIETRVQASRRKRKRTGPGRRRFSSDYKGVSWEKSSGYWKAHIHLGKRHRTLGRFNNEIAAARAYDKAARKHFGAAARLNFPVRKRSGKPSGA